MAQENKLPFGITPIQAAGAIVVLGGGYLIGKKFGLIKGEENVKSEKLDTEKIFQPTYLESLPSGTKYYKFTSKTTIPDIAEKIYKAKGFFKDDMPQFWAAFKRMKYKTQVAQVNQYFTMHYGKEMFAYIHTYLNDVEMSTLYDYLNSLPTGLI